MIKRESYLKEIEKLFKINRIVCLLGPRQCGKTTLARQFWKNFKGVAFPETYFDLENPMDLTALENPNLALQNLTGLIVIDEIQRAPELFSYLRYLHDQNLDQYFLLLGSASRELIHQSNESLAGRISYLEIQPFSFSEVKNMQDLWIKGGFPKSFLLEEEASFRWRQDYVKTYIEQDLGTMGLQFDSILLRRLWFMLAHFHGQIFNASDLGQSLDVTHPTIKKYLSYLTATFMIRLLAPWHENISKRQVKSPKVYFRDSGLFHYFLGIKNHQELIRHPKVGASWEGFVLEEICRKYQTDPQDCFFWGSHNKAELDLLIFKNGKKIGFEIKYQDAPKMTPSLKIALEDLKLDELQVIYPGTKDYHLTDAIKVRSFLNFFDFK